MTAKNTHINATDAEKRLWAAVMLDQPASVRIDLREYVQRWVNEAFENGYALGLKDSL